MFDHETPTTITVDPRRLLRERRVTRADDAIADEKARIREVIDALNLKSPVFIELDFGDERHNDLDEQQLAGMVIEAAGDDRRIEALITWIAERTVTPVETAAA